MDGRVAFGQERYCDAERAFKDAVAKAEVFGERDRRLAETLKEFGRIYALAQRPDILEPLWTRALAIEENAVPPNDAETADSTYWLAELYRHTKRYSQAEELHKRALAIRERVFVDRDLHLIAESASGLGLTFYAQANYGAADPLFRRAIQIWTRVYNPQSEAGARVSLARVLAATGRHAEALALYQRGIVTLESNQGWYAQPKSEVLSRKFESVMTPAEAQALPFGSPYPPFAMSLSLPSALDSYAESLRALGRNAEADEATKKSSDRRNAIEASLNKRRSALPSKLPPEC